MNQNKIWIVTELFYPEETAVAYIFTRIADYLSRNYKVGIICGPEFYDNHKTDFQDDLKLSNQIEIYRTNSLKLDKNSLIQRTLKVILLSLRMGFLIIRKVSKGELVLLATNPAPLLLFVKIIKYFKKFQLHILVHDVFPENTIPAGIFKNDQSVAYKTIKYFFDKSYSSADHLIVIGRDMKQVVSSKVKRFKPAMPISIVTNWTNPDKVEQLNHTRINPKYITLQYAGNIGRVQGLLEILDAFRLCANDKIFLNIHGTGALSPFIETYIQEYKLENIQLKGSFSRSDEHTILANCDIGIVSISKGMFGLGVPSKSYHLLAAGKPILFIGEPNTEISTMVVENGIGWSLDINNQNELIDFFNHLGTVELKELQQMGERSRALSENKYNESATLQLLQMKIENFGSNAQIEPNKEWKV